MVQRQVINVTQLIDEQKIGAFNIMIIALSFLVMMTDGFDLQAAALAGPGIVQSWHINRAALGPVFSASLFGMLFGGPLLGYIGDCFGRRGAIIGGCLLYGSVTLAAAFAHSLNELLMLRFIAGIGLGGLPANCIAINAEFAPKRLRATLIVTMYLGITVGSILPAAVTAAYGEAYRWQTLFLVGGIAPLAVAVILFFSLPESIKFLVKQNRSREKVVRLISVLRPDLSVAPDAEFVILESGSKPKTKFTARLLFTDGLAGITLLVWLLYVVNLMANFFLHSWIPIVLRDTGLSVRQMGISTGMYDFGGIFGALLVSRLLDRWGVATLAAFFALSCPLIAAIGLHGLSVAGLTAAVFMSGFCIVGVQLGLAALVGVIYPTAIRANGAGWSSSVGRFGAILGPMAGGWLISLHVSGGVFFLAPVVPMAIGSVAAFMLMRLCVSRFQGSRLGDTAAPCTRVLATPGAGS